MNLNFTSEPIGNSATPPDLTATRSAEQPAGRGRAWPWSGQTWREYGYLCLQFPLSCVALTYFLLVPSLLAGLAVTVVGLFVAGTLVLGARGWGALYRGLDTGLLGSTVAAPPAFVRPRGFWRTLGATVTDPTGWRALLYMLISFPLALLSWVVSTVWLAVGAGGLTYWFWCRWLPYQTQPDGSRHRGVLINAGDWYWAGDTAYHQFLLVLVGIVFLLMWAPLTRGFTKAFAALGRGLLGPTAGAIRLAELRRQRAATVEDADAKLRRIERDLHDGTQARLVSIAMQLGEAREDLASATDQAVAAASDLVTSAHASTKAALTELREIVRGIHPPALDAGIGLAIKTLAARTAIPVRVQVAPGVDAGPIAPAIASIAYYAVAELLTNVVRHSGASQAEVVIERVADDRGADILRLRVVDNGHGGAAVMTGTPGVGGTGLAGIAQRVASVDGGFTLTSPADGGTTVDITLPTAV